MIIDRAACEWYKLDIDTEPVTSPTDWEASIDDGATWVKAQDVGGYSAWLVAGPDYDGDGEPTMVTSQEATAVKVRLVDSPETVIRGDLQITTKDL